MRRALPGVRRVELSDADPELEARVTIHPMAENLPLHSFLHIVAGVVKRAERGTQLRVAA